MQQELVEFSFIVKTPYFDVTKGSIVVGKGNNTTLKYSLLIVLFYLNLQKNNQM